MQPNTLLGTDKTPIDLQGWDPTKIKKGSRIIPFLLLILMAAAFAVTRLPSGDELIADHLERACANVRKHHEAKEKAEKAKRPPTQTVAKPKELDGRSPPTQPADTTKITEPVSPKESDSKLGPAAKLAADCATTVDPRPSPQEIRTSYLAIKDMAERQKVFQGLKGNEVGISELGRGVVAAIKLFFDSLAMAVVKHGGDTAIAVALAALYSILPGIAGAIYRRSFWTWFGLSFVALLAITSIGTSLAHLKNKDAAAVDEIAGSVFVLLLSQIVVLLLSHRLRRHTSKASALAALMPPRIYNKLLTAALWIAAIGIGYYDVGDWIWPLIPGGFETLYKWNFILLGLPLIYTLFKATATWSGTTRKNIVVCLDGTNNTPDQVEFGQVAQTNVFKLFRALKADQAPAAEPAFDANICKRYKDKQIGFYYVGVGNSFENSGLGATLGQATGLGASGIVDRAYLDIMKVYRPEAGDRIFIFGFSRGAAIARLLARAIHQRGAPRSAWTLRLFGRHWTIWQSKTAKGKTDPVPIAVLGCWDTVGAFGVAKTIAGINFQKIDLFKDLSVPDNVEQAYHLVALDEQRDSFVPTLMEPDPIDPGRIVEVWFSGDHANVGGGWATSKLSDITLDFMLRQVSSGYAYDAKMMPGDESWGLCLSAVAHVKTETVAPPAPESAGTAQDTQLPPPTLQAAKRPPAPPGTVLLDPDVLGQLRQWMSSLYMYQPRVMPLHAVVSDTVFQRMTQSEPVYAPQSLFDLNHQLSEKRNAVATAIDRLKGTKSLTDDEHQRILVYKERLQLKRWSEHIADLGANGTAPDPGQDLALAPTPAAAT